MKKNNSNIPILDITVVDSRAWLYTERWTSRSAADWPGGKRLKLLKGALLKILQQANTTLQDLGLSGHAMRDVKRLKGWFTLRTGRALVSKSFHNGQGSIKVLEKNMKENEAFVEGVSFNISVPLVDMGSDHV